MRIEMDLNDTEGECTVRELYLSVFQPETIYLRNKVNEYVLCSGWVMHQRYWKSGTVFVWKGLRKRLVGMPMRR